MGSDMPKQPTMSVQQAASENCSQSDISRLTKFDAKMIVILDDQLVNLEATKLLLIDFGCKAQI